VNNLKLTEKADDVLDGVEIYSVKEPKKDSSRLENKSDKDLDRDVKRAEKIAKREAKKQGRASTSSKTADTKPDKEVKRAEKIAKREAKKQEKEAKRTGSMTTTIVNVEDGNLINKSVFEELEDLITKISDAVLAVLGLLELGVSAVRDLPAIIKWVIKFIFFSGVVGSKESEE